ncbi:MAG: hypothetical protein AAGC96_08635 [Pseudomonadota bacterium]
MRYLFAFLVLLAGSATASDARKLTGAEIKTLLPTITAVTDTTQQTFAENGDTLYTDPARTTKGRWRVQRDFYCSTWPPSDAWRCYAVELQTGSEEIPDRIIWIDVELGDRSVNDILPGTE